MVPIKDEMKKYTKSLVLRVKSLKSVLLFLNLLTIQNLTLLEIKEY